MLSKTLAIQNYFSQQKPLAFQPFLFHLIWIYKMESRAITLLNIYKSSYLQIFAEIKGKIDSCFKDAKYGSH